MKTPEEHRKAPEQYSKDLGYLRTHGEDRGLMAELRCLLNRNLRMRGWAAVGRIGGIGDRAVETVSGLYALYPQAFKENAFSFGVSCKRLAFRRRKGDAQADDAHSPLDIRFRRLLACDGRPALCDMLPDFVRGMKAEGIAVDYDSLYKDIYYWGDRVREKWAADYWGKAGKEVSDVSD